MTVELDLGGLSEEARAYYAAHEIRRVKPTAEAELIALLERLRLAPLASVLAFEARWGGVLSDRLELGARILRSFDPADDLYDEGDDDLDPAIHANRPPIVPIGKDGEGWLAIDEAARLHRIEFGERPAIAPEADGIEIHLERSARIAIFCEEPVVAFEFEGAPGALPDLAGAARSDALSDGVMEVWESEGLLLANASLRPGLALRPTATTSALLGTDFERACRLLREAAASGRRVLRVASWGRALRRSDRPASEAPALGRLPTGVRFVLPTGMLVVGERSLDEYVVFEDRILEHRRRDDDAAAFEWTRYLAHDPSVFAWASERVRETFAQAIRDPRRHASREVLARLLEERGVPVDERVLRFEEDFGGIDFRSGPVAVLGTWAAASPRGATEGWLQVHLADGRVATRIGFAYPYNLALTDDGRFVLAWEGEDWWDDVHPREVAFECGDRESLLEELARRIRP
jgi:hypothetical protein